jgi:hypothetical protein
MRSRRAEHPADLSDFSDFDEAPDAKRAVEESKHEEAAAVHETLVSDLLKSTPTSESTNRGTPRIRECVERRSIPRLLTLLVHDATSRELPEEPMEELLAELVSALTSKLDARYILDLEVSHEVPAEIKVALADGGTFDLLVLAPRSPTSSDIQEILETIKKGSGSIKTLSEKAILKDAKNAVVAAFLTFDPSSSRQTREDYLSNLHEFVRTILRSERFKRAAGHVHRELSKRLRARCLTFPGLSESLNSPSPFTFSRRFLDQLDSQDLLVAPLTGNSRSAEITTNILKTSSSVLSEGGGGRGGDDDASHFLTPKDLATLALVSAVF